MFNVQITIAESSIGFNRSRGSIASLRSSRLAQLRVQIVQAVQSLSFDVAQDRQFVQIIQGVSRQAAVQKFKVNI
jgi:hypothetical protein